jgi:two-component system, NtrC family, sensor kinase
MPDALPILEELTRLGRALTGSLRRETVAQCVVDALSRLFDIEAAVVAVAGSEGGEPRFELAASLGDPTPPDDDEFLIEVAAAQGVVRRITPPRLGVPLVAANHTMGILAVRGKSGTAFSADDEAVIGAVAAQAAIALQNSRLITLLSTGKHEWEQMVDAISPGICIVDGMGAVRRANRAFANLVGWPVTALTGRPWLMLLPPAWAEPVGRALAKPGLGGGEIRAERRIFSVTAHRISGDPGSVLLIEDVTDTRKLQEQLIQSEKLSAIGQLIAGVAHELNNPLASVLGFADYLAEAATLPENLVEPLRVIQQEAQRAATIVRNLLTFARRQEQDRRRLDIGPVLQRTVALLNNQMIGLKVEPLLVVEPKLPLVEGSPNQLQQVFLNVINNAAQAIASTGRGGTVVIRARPWLDGIAVDVVDDGPGIPEEIHERIFEPFFTTKGEGEGTGLGLSICQGIIREHGGRLTVKSAPGHGATFTIELPGVRAAEAPADAAPAGMARRGRVLVVDDEPHILYYMRATLESWGHQVDTAADGEDALSRASGGGYDLIITDVRMPNLGGRELFERLRQTAPAMADRVVFATGDTVRDDTMAFLEQSGRPFLHKPFKLAELRSTLLAVMERK